MRSGGKVKQRISSGQVSTRGNREWVKFRSPREQVLESNGPTSGPAYQGQPEDHLPLVAADRGIRSQGGPAETRTPGPVYGHLGPVRNPSQPPKRD